MPVDDLMFTTGEVLQIIAVVVAAASAWFYLQSKFRSNEEKLTTVAADMEELSGKFDAVVETTNTRWEEHNKLMDTRFTDLKDTVTKQNEAIIKIEAHGTLLEERLERIAAASS